MTFAVLLAMTLTVFTATAQNIKVKGTVADASGEPIIGATVIVEGTKTGTSTGADGGFSISVPPDATLTFAILGYKTHSEKVAGRTNLIVTLESDAEYLEETIVIGYGSGQKIGNIVGSVTTEHHSRHLHIAPMLKVTVRLGPTPSSRTSASSVSV